MSGEQTWLWPTYRTGARLSPSRRGYGPAWERVRREFLEAHKECQRCGAPAEHAHHIRRVGDGGDHYWRNLLPLCPACHGWTHRDDRGAGGRYGLAVASS